MKHLEDLLNAERELQMSEKMRSGKAQAMKRKGAFLKESEATEGNKEKIKTGMWFGRKTEGGEDPNTFKNEGGGNLLKSSGGGLYEKSSPSGLRRS